MTPDAELVSRCRDGDARAWAELVERYSRYVYAIVVQGFRLRDHDAEDVFQDVFARAYENLGRLRDGGAVRPWLAQLTRNVCVDRLRSAPREELSDQLEPPGLDDTLAVLDDALAVRDALANLSDDCRDILDRFFTRDESYRTIGAALDIPSGTVASRISRCLGYLREEYLGRNSEAAASGQVQ